MSSFAVFAQGQAEVRSADQHQDDYISQKSLSSRLSWSARGRTQRLKVMECKVKLLDGTDYTCTVEKRAKGQVLFDKVCDHLNLLEKDYFGISYRDAENQKNWLDVSKEMKKQISSTSHKLLLCLHPNLFRYYLCLQLRDDVVSGRLPCSFSTHTVLGSYTVQSELGDCDAELQGSSYISDMCLAPNQTKELEEKVLELHRGHKGMTPAEADMLFLENAKKLSMYGVDLHHAKDSEGVEIMLGVCSSGLHVYRDKLRINRFAWPKILKISYKRNNFYIKVRPGELEQFESTIGFKLPNHKAAKRLWKVCVEHHTFFRLVSPEAPPKRFLSLGSKFRYSGRTQAQTRRASAQIARAAPQFQRRHTVTAGMDSSAILQFLDRKQQNIEVEIKEMAMETPFEEEETNSETQEIPARNQEVMCHEEDEDMLQILDQKHQNIEFKDKNKDPAMEEATSETQPDVGVFHNNIESFDQEHVEELYADSFECSQLLFFKEPAHESVNIHPYREFPSSGQNQMEVRPQEQMISVKDEAVSSSVKDVAVVHTETKTITYESAEVDADGDSDAGVFMSAQTITSENESSSTTTHITKTVKDGISETRIEKRIVITGDADHDQALAQAIKEAKEQHPDMSVTKVVVHKETEISAADGDA
uniref:Erythrocyte membrane protein band 4.1-like 3b n=1 Tax=Cyprinus carpio TaxID=7962 RepID=A0A8C1S9B5_CYPCA